MKVAEIKAQTNLNTVTATLKKKVILVIFLTLFADVVVLKVVFA